MDKNQMRYSVLASIAAFGVVLGGCGGSSDSDGGSAPGDQPLDPATQPTEVMQSLIIRAGGNEAVLRDGEPPEKTGDDGDPSVALNSERVEVSSGGGLELSLEFDSNSALSSLFIKLVGALGYAEIQFPENGGKAVQNLVVSIDLPGTIGSGEFCLNISGQDATALVSNTEQVCVTVDRSLLDALQGRWVADCLDGGFESFYSELEIENANVLNTESKYENTTTCQGAPVSTETETWKLVVGELITASDGGEAWEVDIANQTEGSLGLCLFRAEAERFLIGCGDDQVRATSLDEEYLRMQASDSAKFTTAFISGRAFYFSGVEGTALFNGEFISLAQYVFDANGSAIELWSPSDENSYDTNNVYTDLVWNIDSSGKLTTVDTQDDGEVYTFELTPSSVGVNSAEFSWEITAADAGGTVLSSQSGNGSMTAADATLYDFLAGRSFAANIQPDSDIERLVFNADGTGSIRFAPNPDNDFSNNDVNTIHWRAVSGTRLEFTEFGGDGHDSEQTGCEDNPQIECELDYYNFAFNFSDTSVDAASFSWAVEYIEYNEDGSVEGTGSASGTGSMQAE